MLRWWNNVRQIELLEDEVAFWKNHYTYEMIRSDERYAEQWQRAEAWRKYAEELRKYAENQQHALNCYRMADNMEKKRA